MKPDDIQNALETFCRYDERELSFTDATTISLYHARDIDTVLSFDAEFDGLVDRIGV